MGHDKLRKFAENETFTCLLQPSSAELLADGFFNLKDHPVKGNWSGRMFSGRTGDIILELGCGKGEYTIDLARRNPGSNYIGVDIKGARLWKGAKTATENKMENVAFLRTRIELIEAFFAPGEVSEIWLTFSDPQMKSENSRLTSPLFLERYRKFLKPGGIVHLKTDSQFLHQYTKAVCAANSLRVINCTDDLYGGREGIRESVREGGCPASGNIPDAVYEVKTFYEKMFLEQGYRITYMSFTLDHDGKFIYPEFDAAYWRSVEGPRRSFGHKAGE